MKILELPYSKDYLKNRLARLREEMIEAELDDFDEYFQILIDYVDLIEIDDSVYLENMWQSLTEAHAWWKKFYE